MNTLEEVKLREEIVIVEERIRKIESFYYKFLLAVKNTIGAIGGRTFLLVVFLAVLSFKLTDRFLKVGGENQSYVVLLIGQGVFAVLVTGWIYRGKLKTITGPGDFSATFGDSKNPQKPNLNKQKPGRVVDNTFEFNLPNELDSLTEADSEGTLEKSK